MLANASSVKSCQGGRAATWKPSGTCWLASTHQNGTNGEGPGSPRPVIGRTWETAGDLAQFRVALPSSVRPVLAGVEAPEELWRAEAGMRAAVEADGFALLRRPRAGPEVVLGAIAVLAMDAWRVCAALAASRTSRFGARMLFLCMISEERGRWGRARFGGSLIDTA